LVKREKKRQAETLMMIPSENHTSLAVREAVGSLLQDKYCEGYPYKRYYQGQENFDAIESLCIERAKKIFGVPFCNVQALSGAPANSAVYFALLNPGDKIMGLKLDQGGHITHGLNVNFSGKFFKSIFYGVGKDGLIDYKAMRALALKEKPKMIIAGITSYPMQLDFAKFSEIANEVGAWLLGDVSHIAGLIIAGVYPNPVEHCHVVTTTTHKTLRGPRGALIMATEKGLEKDKELGDKINKAVFPGLQGGPHMNNICGIAVALKEAEKESFKEYGKQVVENAKTLADALKQQGFVLCSGGTNTHLILLDISGFDILGNTASEALEQAGIVVNKNAIPFDINPPFYPSGIRLGTPAITSQGMGKEQMVLIANYFSKVIKDIAIIKKEKGFSKEDEKKRETRKQLIEQSFVIKTVKQKVRELCSAFPIKTIY